ncbi:MAG: HpcH/HpaI aldolase/citrate lyase family protein [Paracoccaceae bacterium]
MNYPTNTFTQGLREGRKQFGMWVSLASPFASEIVASAGFDFCVIDMEHSPNELNSVLGQLQAFAAHPTPAIVRPMWNDSVMVKRLLDIGAPGLVFPMVQNAEEAEAAVAACRYPPNGVRGVAGSTRANQFGRVKDYFDRVEEETTIIIQVETRAALDVVDEIAAVEGVSGVFFGPSDIAADLGHLGKPMHPEVWETIRPISKRLADKGMPVGTLVADLDFAGGLLNEEFSFVACSTEAAALARAMDSTVSKMRSLIS